MDFNNYYVMLSKLKIFTENQIRGEEYEIDEDWD